VLAFYYKLIVLTQTTPSELTDFETEIVMDKLNTKQVLRHKPLRNLNLNFKIKIIMLMGVIVGLQNTPYACVIAMSVIQIISIYQLLRTIAKFKNVFSNKLSSFTFLMTEITI
jgi:hypothetical protein